MLSLIMFQIEILDKYMCERVYDLILPFIEITMLKLTFHSYGTMNVVPAAGSQYLLDFLLMYFVLMSKFYLRIPPFNHTYHHLSR